MLKLFITSLVFLSMAGCSTFQRNRTPNQDDLKVTLKDQEGTKKEAPVEASTNAEKPLTPVKVEASEADAKEQAAEMKKAVAAAADHVQATHDSKSTRTAGPVSAEKAEGWLKNGNTRFVKGFFRNDGATGSDRHRLATGQKPHSIILSCSDSRVPPEVVFDQKLGEVFVVRTAGEALDNNVVGSIEYAVEHLGSNLIVVMGHESCGAVKATLSSLSGAQMGTPALEALVADLKPRLQKYANTKPSEGVLEESWSNVDGVSKDLLERSALLRDAVASGEVKIIKAMYHLDSGQVEWR